MGGMGGMGGMGKPDPLFGMMMNQPMGGMGLGGGMPMGVGGMQQFQNPAQQYPSTQPQMNNGPAQGQNRRFPGMPAFTGNGWDF